jgi:cell division protein FtsB
MKLLQLLLVYLLVMLSRVVWQNYQVNQEVALLQRQVDELKASNDDLKARILYYQTESYSEREARAKLGLQKPGEEVIITPTERTKQEETPGSQKPLPNWRQWWEFFFGDSLVDTS